MDIVQLPVVSANNTIRRALDVMVAAGRSGIVTQLKGARTVLELHDLLSAVGEFAAPISSLTPNRSTGQISFDPTLDRKATETALDDQGSAFAVFNIEGAMAHVVTRHEGIGADLTGSPRYYACIGPQSHPHMARPPSGYCKTGDGFRVELVIVP